MTKAANAPGTQPAEPAPSPPREANGHWARGHRAAARTTWIIGGVAVAFYAATLVLGHFGRLDPSWKPQPAATQTEVHHAQPPVRNVAAAPASHAEHP